MKLYIQDIGENNVLETALSVPVTEFSLDLPDGPVILAPMDVKIRAESSKEEVIVLGEITAKVRMSCSRCLNDFESAIVNTIEIIAPLQQEYIDLSDELRQAVLLAIPVKPLCGADCRGLCVQCGSNLNQVTCACIDHAVEKSFLLNKTWLH